MHILEVICVPQTEQENRVIPKNAFSLYRFTIRPFFASVRIPNFVIKHSKKSLNFVIFVIKKRRIP